MNERQLTIGQLINAVLQNKKKCAFVFVLTMTLVTLFWMFAPRKYGSEGKLYIQLGRANTGIEYTKGSMPISIQNARETEVRSIIEMIKSHEVLAKVAQDPSVTVDAVLASPFDWIELPSFKENDADYEKSLRLQKAVKAIAKNMTVDMEKSTTVISIYVKAQDPTLAQAIVNKIMEYTTESHVNVHRRSKTAEFFEVEFEKQKEVVADAEAALKDYRNGQRNKTDYSTPFLSIDGARNTLQLIIDKLENEIVDAELDQIQAQEEVAKLNIELEDIGKFIEVPTQGVERLSTESAKEEIFRLKSERADLVAKYRDHPRIDIITSRLAALESDIEDLPDRTEMMAASNPAYEDVSVEKAKAVAKSNSLTVRLEKAKSKYTSSLEQLVKLNDTQVEIEQLKRKVEIERRYLDTFVDRRGDVSIISRLDEKQVSDIVVQQPATYWVKHVSPKGSILLPLGMIFASGLTLLTALFFENKSSALVQHDQIEQTLDLPVLITLPRVAVRRTMVR